MARSLRRNYPRLYLLSFLMIALFLATAGIILQANDAEEPAPEHSASVVEYPHQVAKLQHDEYI